MTIITGHYGWFFLEVRPLDATPQNYLLLFDNLNVFIFCVRDIAWLQSIFLGRNIHYIIKKEKSEKQNKLIKKKPCFYCGFWERNGLQARAF